MPLLLKVAKCWRIVRGRRKPPFLIQNISCLYFVIWVIVRFLKLCNVKSHKIIYTIEASRSFLGEFNTYSHNVCYDDHVFIEVSLLNLSDKKMFPQYCSFGWCLWLFPCMWLVFHNISILSLCVWQAGINVSKMF